MMSRSRRWQRSTWWLCILICVAMAFVWGGSGCDPTPMPSDGGETTQDGSADQAPSDGPPPQAHDKPTGCHPYARGKDVGDCMMPFPSSYFLIKDDKSETGLRLAIPDGVLPVAQHGDDQKPLKPGPYNQRDGFSPATPIMALFPERVDPALLVKSTELAKSLDAGASIALIEFGTQKRIPYFAEVDKSVKTDDDPQVLLIRPMIRLTPNKRYLVVLTTSLKAVGGGALTVPDAFQRLAAGEAPRTPAEAALAPSVKECVAEAKAAGIDADKILMAWDFHTASDTHILDQMTSMRDQMLKQVGDSGPAYEIKNVYNYTVDQKKDILRAIEGTFQVPSFLDKDEPGSTLLLDADGKPKVRGMGTFRFFVQIPRCAEKATGPLPVMQFGHGLFGGAQGEMDSGYQRGLVNRLCMVQIGHDWIGLAADDRGYVGTQIMTDMNNMPRLVNRLQQAHINAIALTRLVMHKLHKDKALEINGKPIIDGKERYYLGISNGAIQGSAFMALSPDIERGILNVGGAPWNLMISRSSNFAVLYVAMGVFYPNPAERQLLVTLTQPHFDYVDPLTYADYVIKDPKRLGVPAKKIILQEGIGDAQVPNISTRVFARTMGIPALKGLFEPVFGLEVKDGPLDVGAYTQFGPKPTPYPEDANVPAKDNSAHEDARRREGCIKQMEAFFKPDGTIQHFCDGPCDPD